MFEDLTKERMREIEWIDNQKESYCRIDETTRNDF